MMYFCPCSCDDPIDPEPEDNALFSLPRNLSYVQDSYLDRYSVSARFVHNPKIDRCIQHQQGQEWSANVTDETLGLLSAVTAQELHGRCDGDFDSVSSSGFVFPHQDIPNRPGFSPVLSPPTYSWSSVQSSSFSASSLLHPATLVASRISAFLHSPPNESMDSARDIGTSVDGDNVFLSPHSETLPRMDPSRLECPDSLGEEIDRCDSVTFYTSSHSGDSDLEERDASVALLDVNDPPSADICDHANVSDHVLWNPFDFEAKISHPQFEMDNAKRIEVGTCFSSSFELDGDMSLKHPDLGGKTSSSKPDICFYRDNTDRISDVPDLSSSILSAKYPTLKSLNVTDKTYVDNEGGDADINKEQSSGTITDAVTNTLYGSPDSDHFVEEGVFMNVDDLDSTNEKSTTVSDASDDTSVSVDSMFLSPEEGELDDDDSSQILPKMTLEEAINRAASDLTKMSLEMYGSTLAAETSNASSSCSLLDIDDDLKIPPLTLKIAGRSSPVRGPAGLKIKITDQSGMETHNRLTDSSTTLTDSPIYTEDEFNFSRVELRKSSSLKSNKTPPGTPHRKKVVRFADAMGLDLESVRHVLNMESPPKIPASALADLMNGLNEENKEVGTKYLCPCFSQPGAADNFAQKVRNQKVSLENAILNDLTITGIVRVANISYHKNVRIRYTHNAWSSFYDIAASYVQSSCDGPTDRFSFSIVAPPFFGPGSRLEFAVCYIADGVEYWDNNDGHNYVFECFAKTIPTDSELAWLHFL